jgi:hypothetical protein
MIKKRPAWGASLCTQWERSNSITADAGPAQAPMFSSTLLPVRL